MLCGETMSTNDQSAQVTRSSIAEKSVSDREWTYLFRAATNKSVDCLLRELDTTHKDKKDLMMKLYPPVNDGKLSMNGYQQVCCGDNESAELELHPPVKALMNAILTDPGKPQRRNCRSY
jgi:hypothetical protein